MFRQFLTILIAAAIILTTATVPADPGNSKWVGQSAKFRKFRMFGKNHRFQSYDLPRGRMRSKLESLPKPAYRRGMEWLHRFDFPENDLESMVIDDEGAVLYVDPAPIDLQTDVQQAPPNDGAALQPAASAADDAFLLHSRSNATHVLYLDFDGHSFSGTAWSNGTINARPFDLDGSPSTFNATER